MSFSGSGYVHYNVPSVEFYDVIDIRLSFRLDAKVDNGEMLSVFGVSDFCIIDVSNNTPPPPHTYLPSYYVAAT